MLFYICRRESGLESVTGWEVEVSPGLRDVLVYRPYRPDESDDERALVAPYLTLLRESAEQRAHPLREMFNALNCLVRYGVAWRAISNGLPAWHAVHGQASRWLHAGPSKCWPTTCARYPAVNTAGHPLALHAAPGCRERLNRFANDQTSLATNMNTTVRWQHGPITANTVVYSASTTLGLLLANPSRNQRCLQARVPMIASAYNSLHAPSRRYPPAQPTTAFRPDGLFTEPPSQAPCRQGP